MRMIDNMIANDIDVLDMTVIDQMTQDLGPDATMEFLEMFQTYAPEGMSGFQAAVADRNVGGVVHFSHDLKNSAATMGLMRLSCLCRDIEMAADDDKLEEAIDLAKELPLTMAQALQALTAINVRDTLET
jgi:HPt (histidine-containing phosphotransfer) domain-containing protein